MYDVRLNSNVTRGEISNTQRGTVLVRLWIYQREQPLEFKLEGDCLRDIAGSHFHFINKPLEPFAPLEVDLQPLSLLPGVTGEITASARLCMHKPNDLGQYGKPVFINVLRLEMFCGMGRVILECFDCRVDLINTEWVMTEAEEFAQKASNFASWQAHIAQAPVADLQRHPQVLAVLYDEMHQRFGDSLDFDQHEAALMGWHGITSVLADEREINVLSDDFTASSASDIMRKADGDTFPGEDLMAELVDELAMEESEWEEQKDQHPILESVQDLIEDFEIQAAKLTFPRGRHYQNLINTLDEVEERLTNLLKPAITEAEAVSMESGMLGCRESMGKMMVGFQHLSSLIEITESTEGRRELLYLRDGMLELRESISALRFQLHNL